MPVRTVSGTPTTPAAPEDARVRELREKVSQHVTEKFAGDFRKAFDHYDTDKDGSISKAELLEFLKASKVGNVFTRGKWASGILDTFDGAQGDNDRKVSWEEFLRGIGSGGQGG